jgi:hypothetical protein
MRTLAPLGGPGRQLLQHERRPSQRALQEWWFRMGGTATKLHMLAIGVGEPEFEFAEVKCDNRVEALVNVYKYTGPFPFGKRVIGT